MDRINLIQTSVDEWIVLRELRQQPKAVIHRVTAVAGGDRYMLYTWQPEPSQRRLVGVYEKLIDAEREVPWPDPKAAGVPRPGRTPAENLADMRRRGVDGTGHIGPDKAH